jgi:transposase
MWCIPPKANGEFVWRMEAILELYKLPYDPLFPVVCMDEASKQLVGEVRQPQQVQPGQVLRQDSEYERKGTCNLFMFFEPLRGWRHVWVTDHRRKIEWACCVKELLDAHYPEAIKVRLVCDNLNTHTGGALYQAFAAREAKRLCDRLEFHPTPKHGSWLNMAELELSILVRQCLRQRFASREAIERAATAWTERRNTAAATIDRHFTTADARTKLWRLYPALED